MTEQVRSRTGAPTGWAGPAPDDADPTGGRHVLDQDAGLTPIFTTLRRGEWRRPRPQSARRALRPVPDPAPYPAPYSNDPWTAPIPVVPPLTLVDDPLGVGATGGYGAVSGYEPPASETETTAWGIPVVTEPAGGFEHADPYGSGSYEATSYGSAGYDPQPHIPAPYDQRGYDQRGYDQRGYDQRGYDRAGYDPAPYQPTAHEPVLYGPPNRFARPDQRPYRYDPLTDTGRHHRRLAPAGW